MPESGRRGRGCRRSPTAPCRSRACAIFEMTPSSPPFFTPYGSSVTTIAVRPPRSSSMWARARMTMRPRPVRYASRMPPRPTMIPLRREVRPLHVLGQAVHVDVAASSISATTASIVSREVVRRDVRRHPDRDPGGAVHEQVGEARRQDGRLLARLVVVRDEVHRVRVDVAQQLGREPREPALGVAHRGGRDSRRCCRSCPARPRAGSAWRRAARAGRACRRSTGRRAGGRSPSRRRRCARTSCTGGSAACRPRASRRGRGDARASGRRGRPAGRATRSRSSRSRGSSSASPVSSSRDSMRPAPSGSTVVMASPTHPGSARLVRFAR